MKANELRIGNYYDQFGNIHQVNGTVITELEKAPEGQIWCKPIPLTEEILLKCGARRIDKYTFVLKGLFIHLRKIGFVFNVGKKKIVIEHLHTLQNLTFALTGEELNYTP